MTVLDERRANRQHKTTTHVVIGILVGAGIQQQPHAVRVASFSGVDQRRASALRQIRIQARIQIARHIHVKPGIRAPSHSLNIQSDLVKKNCVVEFDVGAFIQQCSYFIVTTLFRGIQQLFVPTKCMMQIQYASEELHIQNTGTRRSKHACSKDRAIIKQLDAIKHEPQWRTSGPSTDTSASSISTSSAAVPSRATPAPPSVSWSASGLIPKGPGWYTSRC
jgi:hypothetical protein